MSASTQHSCIRTSWHASKQPGKLSLTHGTAKPASKGEQSITKSKAKRRELHTATPSPDHSPEQLRSLQSRLISYLEPLRAVPPATAPYVRLTCDLPQPQWVRITSAHESPVYTCDNFLSRAECDILIKAAAQRLAPSKLGTDDVQLATRGAGALRTSSSCSLQHSGDFASPACSALTRKIAALTGKSAKCFEPYNVTRYTRGGFQPCPSAI